MVIFSNEFVIIEIDNIWYMFFVWKLVKFEWLFLLIIMWGWELFNIRILCVIGVLWFIGI